MNQSKYLDEIKSNDSNLTSTASEDLSYLEAERIIRTYAIPILFGLIFVLGLLGNLLVIVAVISNRHMRSTTYILILNLAVADVCFIVFCLPFAAIQYILWVWPFGEIWC
jgi:allatostatin receptor